MKKIVYYIVIIIGIVGLLVFVKFRNNNVLNIGETREITIINKDEEGNVLKKVNVTLLNEINDFKQIIKNLKSVKNDYNFDVNNEIEIKYNNDVSIFFNLDANYCIIFNYNKDDHHVFELSLELINWTKEQLNK